MLTVLLCITAACTKAPEDAPPAAAKSGGKLVVKMLDIGQGDALLIRSPEQTILVDSGDVDKREELVKLLRAEKVSEIDKLITTHPHADHLGGAYAVLKNFTVKEALDNGQPTTNKTYQTYLKLLKEKKVAYKTLRAGDKVDFGGGASLEVFNPTDGDVKKGGDLNNNSIVGKLTYGKFSMLLTGDCEANREKVLMEEYGQSLQADVLKAPHHGSKTSSNRNFLKLVAPKDVLISCGAGNDYGHPHKEILNKYKDLKLNIYRTDKDGTITVETGGDTYTITKERQ